MQTAAAGLDMVFKFLRAVIAFVFIFHGLRPDTPGHTPDDTVFGIHTITEEERELKLKQKDLPYERRDHALFTAFAPYKNPRYALSVLIEHGGTGASIAAPIAKKIIKKVIDRHQLRKKYQQDLFQEI